MKERSKRTIPRRLLAWALAVCMMFPLLPGTALAVDEYNPADVAVINAIIQNNSLAATKDDPASWESSRFVTWDTSTPKRIKELYLNHKSLSGTLDVSGLQYLTTLHCENNALTGLNVSGLTALTILSCHLNPELATLTGLGDLTNLERLYCYGNQLETLTGLDNLTNLEKLYCYDNKLTELDVSALSNLQTLFCESNPISSLKLPGDVVLTVSPSEHNTAELYSFNYDTKSVTLQALAGSGYGFQRWEQTEGNLETEVTGNRATFTLTGSTTFTPVFAQPTVDSNIFANGAALILAAGKPTTTNTVIYIDKNRDGKIDPDDEIFTPGGGADNNTEEGNDLHAKSVFGGSKDAPVGGDTKLNMTGGKVGLLVGGGMGADAAVENTDVSLSGGEVFSLVGGGSYSDVTGKSTVTVTDGAVTNYLCGGSGGVGSTGSTSVTVSGDAKIENLYGGGILGTVTGAATVSVKGGTIGNLYGGGRDTGATVGAGSSVTVSGAAKVGDAYGGGLILNGGDDAVVNGVNQFIIDPNLTADAAVYVVPPVGYAPGDPITNTGVAADNLRYIHVGGSANLEPYFDDTDSTIKLRAAANDDTRYRATATDQWQPGTLADALAAGGEIELLRNVTLAGTLGTTKPFQLDLQGHTFTGGLELNDDVARTITDSVGGGFIVGAKGVAEGLGHGYAAVNVSTGSLTLAGDKPFTLRGGDSADLENKSGGKGVYVFSGSLTIQNPAVTLQGGDGYTANANGGTGCTIDNGSLVTAGGTFRGGNGGTNGEGGNGCFVDSSTFSITGGVFQGGDGESNRGGQGLRLDGAKSLSSLTVTSATGGRDGRGLDIYKTPLAVTGGVFRGGMGINVNQSTLTVTNADVSGWQALNVFNGAAVISGGTFTGTGAGGTGLYLNGSTAAATLLGGSFTGQSGGYAVDASGSNAADVSALLESGYAYYQDNEELTTGLDGKTLAQNGVVTVAPAGETRYSISGTVKDSGGNPVANADVTLKQGGAFVGSDVSNPDGAYSFANVKSGVYNVIAAKDGKSQTILVTVTDGNQTAQDLQFPADNKNTVVEVKGADTPPAVVGGLEQVTEQQAANTTVKLTVEKLDAPAAADEIKGVAGASELLYLDMRLVKITGGTTDSIEDTGAHVLEIVVPYDSAKPFVAVYRKHGAEPAQALTRLDEKPASPTDGSYWPDASAGALHIYASKFSTYAIGYAENAYTVTFDSQGGSAVASQRIAQGGRAAQPADPTWSDHTFGGWFTDAACTAPWDFSGAVTADMTLYAKWTQPGGTPSGSSGSGTTRYTLTATAGEGGSISPSGKVTVTRGGDKTFTITAGNGYAVADVLVDGKSVGAVTSYTFQKVTGAHTIEARFQQAGGTAAQNPFTDVKPGDWFYDSVQYVYEHNLMNGAEPTAFSPHTSTTRGMIVTILWRLEQKPESGAAMAFADVKAGSYCRDAVAWAAENGIVKGYDETTFGPDDAITREQLAAILYRYAQHKGYDVSVGEDTNILSYKDFDAISEYAIPALQWACGAGIMNGKGGGALDPKGTATRAEAAVMLTRFITANQPA